MKIAVLMTCFNRAQTTVECLRRLMECKLPENCAIDIWLNEDHCTDGTIDAVQGLSLVAPFNLYLIHGSGHDYWCGGMRRAWKAAVESGNNYDGYLWLNDDTWLEKDALQVLFEDRNRYLNCIEVGAICSRDGLKATFGGENTCGFVFPNGQWQNLRQMNGNVVWIPQAVYNEIGMFNECWTHAWGDGDYSRTAVEMGIEVLLTPKFIGRCDHDRKLSSWKDASVPMIKRFRSLYSPLGYSEPPLLFRYCFKHDGLLVAIKNYMSCHLKTLCPRLLK